MAKTTRKHRTLTLRGDKQLRAIDSPLRLELIGLFTDREPLSVAQMAERMGRPATALHYHVRVLEAAGLLRREGERRSGRRPEAVYRPVADVFSLEVRKGGAAAPAETALKAMVNAFRMAEGDMKAALNDPATRRSGPHRNLLGARIHCCLSREQLAELNRHLQGIVKMLSRGHKTHRPSPGDSFVSLTVVLAPLRNREVQS